MADFSFSNGVGKSLESQLRDLRKQISNLSSGLSDHGIDFQDLADDAGDFLHGAQKKARRVTRHAKREADVLTKAAQKAPAAAGTALGTAVLVGIGIGLLYHFVQRR